MPNPRHWTMDKYGGACRFCHSNHVQFCQLCKEFGKNSGLSVVWSHHTELNSFLFSGLTCFSEVSSLFLISVYNFFRSQCVLCIIIIALRVQTRDTRLKAESQASCTIHQDWHNRLKVCKTEIMLSLCFVWKLNDSPSLVKFFCLRIKNLRMEKILPSLVGLDSQPTRLDHHPLSEEANW